MGLKILIFYIIFILLLGMILKKSGNKKQDNFYDYIIISNIYIFILSGLLKLNNIVYNNIFLISLFQIIINIIFKTSIKEISIINNKYNLKNIYQQ